MRISDWSSDVCSSDLRAVVVGVDEVGQRLGVDELVVGLHRGPGAHDTDVAVGDRQREHHQPRSEERRVGKECVVRVDLGGRRIIKKKKKNESDIERSDNKTNGKEEYKINNKKN